MKYSGNIPAGTLLTEFNDICDSIANISQAQTTRLLPPLEAPLRMNHDGHILNSGLVDMIKIERLQSGNSEIEPSQLQPPIEDVPGEDHRLYREDREVLQPTEDSSLMLVPPPSGNSMTQSDGIFLDYFDASALQFESDMASSDWLDFV
jgi:hypothetical protein